MDRLLQDLRYSLRLLRRQPGFTAVTVLTLGLGIGGTTAMFGVLNNVFLRPLPFAEEGRLLRIRDFTLSPGGEELRFSVADREFFALREETEIFAAVAAQHNRSLTLSGGDRPQRLGAIAVSGAWLRTLGVEPLLGRDFDRREKELGEASRTVLISHGLWRRHLGGESRAVGSTVRLDGQAHVVVGVLPPGFRYPYEADVWIPGRFDPNNGRRHELNVVARLRPGVTLQQARDRLDGLARTLAAEFPDTSEGIGFHVEPLRQDLIDEEDQVALTLMAEVAFLLLIACANVANLLLARQVTRRRELALRAALGAGAGHQLRQVLTEAIVLSGLGGAFGLLLTVLGSRYLVVLVPDSLTTGFGMPAVTTDLRVLGFALAVCLATGLLFGLAPALGASRVDLRQALAEGSRSTGDGQPRSLSALAIAETALALVLLAGAGVMILHLRNLQRVDLGFDVADLVTMQISLGSDYETAGRRAAFVHQLLEKTAALAGVEAAGLTTVNPICCGDWGAWAAFEGQDLPPDAPPMIVAHQYVSPGYFEAMGIRLLKGRLFDEGDRQGTQPVAIVDFRLAESLWPDDDPVGKRLKRGPLESDHPWLTVVGVVEEIRDDSDYSEAWYLPYLQYPLERSTEHVHLMVRAARRPAAIIPSIQAAVWSLDPNLAIYDTATMEQVRADGLEQDRLGAEVMALFAGFGLILGGLGIYGIVSFGAHRRRQEIGVRMALGASRSQVLRMILSHGLRLYGAGSLLGLVSTLVLARLLRSLVPQLPAINLSIYLGVTTILGLVAVGASVLPARRAARLDPLAVLRQE